MHQMSAIAFAFAIEFFLLCSVHLRFSEMHFDTHSVKCNSDSIGVLFSRSRTWQQQYFTYASTHFILWMLISFAIISLLQILCHLVSFLHLLGDFVSGFKGFIWYLEYAFCFVNSEFFFSVFILGVCVIAGKCNSNLYVSISIGGTNNSLS